MAHEVLTKMVLKAQSNGPSGGNSIRFNSQWCSYLIVCR
jgi:hypothetical protein